MCSTCKGGGGTSGRGRTAYSPKKSGSTIWSSGGRKTSTGSSSTDGRASQFGTPRIRTSFGRKK